jgi:hypothetical protein
MILTPEHPTSYTLFIDSPLIDFQCSFHNEKNNYIFAVLYTAQRVIYTARMHFTYTEFWGVKFISLRLLCHSNIYHKECSSDHVIDGIT